VSGGAAVDGARLELIARQKAVFLERNSRSAVLEPGSDPWTISVAHSEADVERYVENFEAFASALSA
jgi:hypothetical protein